MEDPAALQGLLSTLSSLASAAVSRFGPGGPPDDDGDTKVQPIKLS